MTERPQRLTPHAFQLEDIDALVAAGRGFVVAETGAGKTVIGAETARRLNVQTVLIIGVRDTHVDEWGGSVMSQAGIDLRIIDGSDGGKQAMFDLQVEEPGWYIVTPQMFTRWGLEGGKSGISDKVVKTIRPDMVIVDEAHLVANRASKGGQLLRKLQTPHPYVMSGTIVRNKFENFWNLNRFVYADRDGHGDIADTSFWRWVSKWCETKFNPHAEGGVEIVGEKNPGALAAAIPCYRQHFKYETCCAHHPGGFSEIPKPKQIEHFVDLTEEQATAIESMSESYVAWLGHNVETERAVIAKLPIVAQVRLRQMALAMPSFVEVGRDDRDMPIYEIGFAPGCASPKLDLFKRRLEKTGWTYLAVTSSEKFAREAVRRIQEDWGYTAALWAGTVSKRDRAETKRAFIAGEIQVLMGTIESVSTGIDGLQHATNHLFWFDQSRDMTSNVQTEGRLDRHGQQVQVTSERALARGSMDLDIMNDQLKRRLALNASIRRQRAREAKKS